MKLLYKSILCVGFFWATQLFATNYYLKLPADLDGNPSIFTGSFWYSTVDCQDGTNYTGQTLAFTSEDYLYRTVANLTANKLLNIGSGTTNLGGIVLNSDISGTDSFSIFASGTATLNLGSISQNSNQNLTIRKAAGSSGFGVSLGSANIDKAMVTLGSAGNGEFLTSLNVSGDVSVDSVTSGSAATLNVNAVSATLAKTLIVNGSSASANFGVGLYSGSGATLALDGGATVTNAGKLSLGYYSGAYFRLQNVNVDADITLTGGSNLYVRADNFVSSANVSATNSGIMIEQGYGGISNFTAKGLSFTGSSDNFVMGTVTSAAGVFAATSSVSSLSVGDLVVNFTGGSYKNIAVNSFNVKSDAITGATGTFNFSSTNPRLFMSANFIDIDNFNMSGTSSTVIFGASRNTNTDITYAGTADIGNFNGAANTYLRLGAQYQTSVWAFGMYDNINIGSLTSVGKEVRLHGNNVNIGALSLEPVAGASMTGVFGESGGAIGTLTIGKDADSVSRISAKNNALTLNVYASAIVFKGSFGIEDGAYLKLNNTQTLLNAEKISLDSVTKSTQLDIGSSSSTIKAASIDAIEFKNSSSTFSGRVNFNVTDGAQVGVINVSDTALNAALGIYGTSRVDEVNLAFGSALTAYLYNNAAFSLGDINITNSAALNFNNQNSSVLNTVEMDSLTISNSAQTSTNNTYLRAINNTYLVVKGDLTIANSSGTMNGFQLSNGAEIRGVFRNLGSRINLVTSIPKASPQTITYTVGGIAGSGATGTSPDYSGGRVHLVINGTSALGTLQYTGLLLDVNDNDTVEEVVSYGSEYTISITMNSSDGSLVQYIRGRNSVRGGVTLQNGTLMLSTNAYTASGTQNFGAVSLQGGALGACGTIEEIGVLNVASLAWSGGKILVDLSASGSADLIDIAGNFTKGAASEFVFEFTSDGDLVSTPYKILNWADEATVDFSVEDFSAYFADGESYDVQFIMNLGGESGLWVQVVPEPAQIAAIFGAAALLFAFKRKKGRW